MRMKYSQYKRHYSDCKTVSDSYDKVSKTIDVIVPDGRLKPSGVRGESFHGYQLWFEDSSGKQCYYTYRAVSLENAKNRHYKNCESAGYKPIDPPAEKLAHIHP